MTQSSKNNYTAADIERYHAGTMTHAERHALEKAALDDPFLADALEGYRFTSTPAEDLNKIRARLDESTGEKRGIFARMNFFRAAAIVLVMAGAGWLSYSLLSTHEKNIALDTPAKESSQPVKPSGQEPVSDSDRDRSGPEIGLMRSDTFPPAITAAPSSSTQKSPPATEVVVNSKGYFNKSGAVSPADTSPNALNDRRAQETASVSTSNGATVNYSLNNASRNPDPSGNNIYYKQKAAEEALPAQAAINNDRLRKQVVNNAMAKDSEMKKEALALSRKNAEMETRAATRAATDTIRHFDVVLQEQKMAMDEVVVVSPGRQPKQKADRYAMVKIDTLEPAEGIAQFDEYITANIKKPEELNVKNQSGEVQLSFDVNSNGEPVNITVVKSLCEKCDEEAIRLLKEGPRWKKKKNLRGRITIRF